MNNIDRIYYFYNYYKYYYLLNYFFIGISEINFIYYPKNHLINRLL